MIVMSVVKQFLWGVMCWILCDHDECGSALPLRRNVLDMV